MCGKKEKDRKRHPIWWVDLAVSFPVAQGKKEDTINSGNCGAQKVKLKPLRMRRLVLPGPEN